MSDQNAGDAGKPPEPGDPHTQEVRYPHISARVPDKVVRGVFSNGVLVLQGAYEFALDFTQRIAKPHQIVARVVLPPAVVPSMIAALSENLNRYTSTFGPVPPLMVPQPPPKPVPVNEIYEDLKLPDDMLAGVYANAAMITHSQAEFCFDFITNLYPRSAVSCRVYLAAPHIPGLLNSLNQSFQQFQQKIAQQQQQQQKRPPDSLN